MSIKNHVDTISRDWSFVSSFFMECEKIDLRIYFPFIPNLNAISTSWYYTQNQRSMFVFPVQVCKNVWTIFLGNSTTRQNEHKIAKSISEPLSIMHEVQVMNRIFQDLELLFGLYSISQFRSVFFLEIKPWISLRQFSSDNGTRIQFSVFHRSYVLRSCSHVKNSFQYNIGTLHSIKSVKKIYS